MGSNPPSLNPGQMGAPTGPNQPDQTPTEFAASMAALIEEAFDQLRKSDGVKPDLILDSNTSDVRDRRMLFVAIAQGIVKHLVANPAAIQVSAGSVVNSANVVIGQVQGQTVQLAVDPTLLVP